MIIVLETLEITQRGEHWRFSSLIVLLFSVFVLGVQCHYYMMMNISKIRIVKEDNNFYSLDVEGLEEGVLETMPWEKVTKLCCLGKVFVTVLR